MCACVLSLSPSFSFLSILVDLMYATSTPGHVCLAAPTRGGWLVPPSLCLPTYLSGPVWSNACRQPCAFFFFFFFLFSSLSICSLSHDRHGWTVPHPSFSSVFLHHFLSLCALPAAPPPPPTTLLVNDLTFGAPLTILQRLLHVCVPVSVSKAQIDELGKWNEARWSGHLFEREGE